MPRYGLMFFPRSPETVVESAGLMETLGYDFLGLVDSHALAMDVYVALTLAATHTTGLRLGPCVTNPVTRHLTVTAAAMASLQLVSHGRAVLGISRGFSGSRAVGVEPARTSDLAVVVPRLRSLMAGEAADVDHTPVRLAWTRQAVPIMVAASGPQGLRIAGRVADAVLVHMGVSPEIVTAAVREVRAGAEEAGRDPGAVEIWAFGAAACASDDQAARDSVKPIVAGMGASVFSPSAEGKHLPAELEAPIARLRREYRVTEHMQRGQHRNSALLDELGLSGYLVDRFAFAGTPAQVRAQVDRLRAVGVDRFIFNVSTAADLPAEIRALAAALALPARPPAVPTA